VEDVAKLESRAQKNDGRGARGYMDAVQPDLDRRAGAALVMVICKSPP